MRCHRGTSGLPGMSITQALLDKLYDNPQVEQIFSATAQRLLTENGTVVGVEYTKKGKTYQRRGPVILATGGFGASKDLLAKYRPELGTVPTTNGAHCSGDGIKMATMPDVGGDVIDMKWVQVHPTGLLDPKDPNNKVKTLAAEALRGTGAIMINGDG